MEKKLRLLGVVWIVAMVAGSSALALAPMGPPTAGLNQGQFRVGAEYGYSEMDLEIDPNNWPVDGTIKDLESNMFFATLGYGVMDNWEVYVQLGVANAEFDKMEWSDDPNDEKWGFDSDYEFAYGFGTKYTFWEQMEGLTWGVLFQMKWFNPEDTVTWYSYFLDLGEGAYEIGGEVETLELDYYEMQIAVGPTWQAMDGLCVYGGPFLHLVSGDVDGHWTESYAVYDSAGTLVDSGVDDSGKWSGDLEEESTFGGYFGAQLDVTEQMTAFAELMFTGDAWGIGIGGGWVF
jgi:hypothetical protein